MSRRRIRQTLLTTMPIPRETMLDLVMPLAEAPSRRRTAESVAVTSPMPICR